MFDFITAFAAAWNSTPIVGAIVLLCIKASAILLFTALGVAALRLSAARRHMLWAAGIAAAVVLPFLTVSLPAWRVPVHYVPAVQTDAPTSEQTPLITDRSAPIITRAALPQQDRPAGSANESVSRNAALGTEQTGRIDSPHRPLGWPVALLAIWLLGAFAALAPWIVGVMVRARLAGSASDLLPGRWERSLRTLRREGHVPARVRVLASASCTTPMTWGIVNPIVLVPANSHWQEGERRNALLHELAHVRRADYAVKLVARALCVLYWFNPIAWLAARAERLAREQACDDAVLRYGSRASEYAQQLLEVAHGAPRTAAVATLTMARRSNLSRRLRAILEVAHDRSPSGRRLASAAFGAVCAVVPPLATLTPDWVRIQAPPNEPAAPVVVLPAAQTSTATQNPARSMPPVAAPAQQTSACAPTPRKPAASISISSRTSRSDRGMHVKWDNGTCRIELRARGEFTLSPNADDVVALTSGGYFEIEHDDGRGERRVRLERDGSGITRTYWIDRRQVPWDAAAAEWFAQTIITLDRRTAFAVDTRLPLLLQRGGVDAVMDEVALMQSTYPMRVYYTKLIEQRRLTSAELVRILETATRAFDSGYEKTELLLTVARQSAFGEPVHLAYAQLAKSIESDYEKRRAFSALLARNDLKPEVVRTMLEATEGMKSDYELAELLIAIDRRYAVDEATRPFYIRALETIESDHEQRRVLSAVTRGGALPSGVTQEIITIAGRSMKGYELAEYLIEIANKGTLNEAASAAFFTATDNLKSDYEQRRVLETLLKKGQLSKAVIEGILKTAASIEGDYECAELLISVSRAVKIDDSLRPAYERAAATIGGDYEYGRAMAAVRRSAQR